LNQAEPVRFCIAPRLGVASCRAAWGAGAARPLC
jgi:hypothetical protein